MTVEGHRLFTGISDQGRGMSAAEIAELFSFHKTAGTTESGAAGVAMTISKEFLIKLGGKIWAESEPGKGTLFIFYVPLEQVR